MLKRHAGREQGVIPIGCNCGGGRAAAAAVNEAALRSGSGVPTAWRLFHPSGGTVDYFDPGAAEKASQAVPGSYVRKVNTHTGQVIE
jgi:hypothetical protein